MYKWCFKHKRLFVFLWCVPISTLLYLYVQKNNGPLWIVYFLFFSLLLSSLALLSGYPKKLSIKKINLLNEKCDPYPFINEMEDQLSYNRSKTNEQYLLTMYCYGLLSIGDFKKVKEILESINIDKYNGILQITKVLYYMNLASAYLGLDDIEKAEIWQNKSKQINNDVSKFQKRYNLELSNLNEIEITIRKKDYDKAINLIEQSSYINLKSVVRAALLLAGIYIAQERIEEAKVKLEFVIKSGNKLFDVQKAEQFLKEIQSYMLDKEA